MFTKTKKLFQEYISIGADENTSINDLKKIQLLHIFCNTWHLFSILSIIEDLIRNRLTFFICFCYMTMITLVITVQVLLSKQKTTTAGLLFISNIFIIVLIFCNYIYPGELLEYYLLLPPSIGLIYIDNKKINITILMLCLFALFLPNLLFKHYPISILNNMNPSFLFFSFFIVVSYFKNLNFRNEKILEAKTKELEELDQFKSQFFTNISHEIRTPLTIVNGYIAELEEDSSKAKEIKQSVKKQVLKITNIVDSVLDLAKMQTSNFSLQLKSTNVSELLRKQFVNFESLFSQKNIDFHLENTKMDYYSLIDPVLFEKAINNLIINALKYTDKGKVNIICTTESNQLIVKITDTGVGIADVNSESVFNRFYQVNNDINKSGGSGIGLAFCKEIIDLHQGTISLKSELNKGSEFTIKIPLEKCLSTIIDKESFAINKEEKTASLKVIKTPKIKSHFLIIDDSYDMRKYLRSILPNYNCLEASNGIEALEIISKYKVDFIITDYMMPKLNGYELVKQLDRNKNNIPIIMLTAKTDMETKLDVLKLGIDDYITKPFHKNELLARIDNCTKNFTAQKIYNENNHKEIKSSEEDKFIAKLKDYIIKNSENTSLNQEIIAYEFKISKSSFYRKIKSTTGLTPNNFIREVRLQKAYSIIQKDSNINLKELASKVGFQHTSYFSKVYENRFGIKPIA